ncbi:MAG TPA: hypothetical protein PKM08_07870 [Syntrophorhabdaceae bacterium]|nr:hypothetical protein [Syntrophorhabdaceae bacterium]
MKEKKKAKQSLPDFCDLMCAYASMPKETAVDGAGSCRTFAALYCKKRKSLVHKNMPCKDKKISVKGKK